MVSSILPSIDIPFGSFKNGLCSFSLCQIRRMKGWPTNSFVTDLRLNVTFGRHFWTSLLGFTFGFHFWTSLLNIILVKTAFLLTPREALFYGDLDGCVMELTWWGSATNGATPYSLHYWQNAKERRRKKSLSKWPLFSGQSSQQSLGCRTNSGLTAFVLLREIVNEPIKLFGKWWIFQRCGVSNGRQWHQGSYPI